MAQSFIQYGTLAWNGCNTTLKYNLSIGQKNLIKIILNKPKTFLSCELFKLLKVLDIENLNKDKWNVLFTLANLFHDKKQICNFRKNNLEISFVCTKKASISVIPSWIKIFKCDSKRNFKLFKLFTLKVQIKKYMYTLYIYYHSTTTYVIGV